MKRALAALALASIPLPAVALAETADEEDDEEAAESRPDQALQVADWVAATGDNGDLPYMILDKATAELSVFEPDGEFLGATPALLGSARGDHSTPGVGDRELSKIKPADRTTPAGRFVASFGRAYGNHTVLWVDYPNAISLHPVITANPKERRPQRLKSPTPKDNRITYGCINIAPAFYQTVVRKHFGKSGGIVYILPEAMELTDAFPSFRVQAISLEQPLAAQLAED